MEEIINKEIAKRLMALRGEVRGAVFKTDIQFINREEGKDGIKKIEQEMENLDYPFEYEKVRTTGFYPIGLRAVTLLVMKKIFGFSDQKITEMGISAPKSSFIIRLSMKFLGFSRSPELWYKNSSDLWKKFVTIGSFKVLEFDEKDKKMVREKIEDIKIHPVLCAYLLGILPSFNEVARGLKATSSRETKCIHRGDEYHEFLIRW